MSSPKAWDMVFEGRIADRLRKPRTAGVTMVIDKNLGMHGLTDLLETAGDALDHIKFAFGTSVALDEHTLRTKIQMCREYGVDTYPGGTLLEAAIVHGVLPEYLRQARALGFGMLEVSDGTITLSHEHRTAVIKQAQDMGFKVISEVGKKDPRHQPSIQAMLGCIAADISLGVDYVIIEAREGGHGVGIYDATGAVDQLELNELAAGIAWPERIVWEAPLTSQQAHMINRFGTNVNLGNIAPTDALGLEALRKGLRFETLRKAAVEYEAAEAAHDPFSRLLAAAHGTDGR